MYVCDPREHAESKVKCLRDFLARANTVGEAVPKVQDQLELANWELSTLSDAPPEIIDKRGRELSELFKQDVNVYRRVLPEVPKIDPILLNVSMASTTTTASDVYFIADNARSSGVEALSGWGVRHAEEYELLQENSGREAEVRSLLCRLKPELASEFDQGVSAVRSCLAQAVTQETAGIAMRNVLEHYKGELIDLARMHSRKQKLTWSECAERLIVDDMSRVRFTKQEERWKDLHGRLSRLAKGLVQLDAMELRTTFHKFVDHLYSALSLIFSSAP